MDAGIEKIPLVSIRLKCAKRHRHRVIQRAALYEMRLVESERINLSLSHRPNGLIGHFWEEFNMVGPKYEVQS